MKIPRPDRKPRGFIRRCGRAAAKSVGLGLLLLALTAAGAASDDAAVLGRLAAASQTRPLPAKGPAEDLELFFLAELLADAGRQDQADAYRRYLRAYHADSPLARLNPGNEEEGYLPEAFEPDPEFWRLVRDGTQRLQRSVNAKDDADWLFLMRCATESPGLPLPVDKLQEFLRTYPDSELAGWAAYQLAWLSRFAFGAEGREGLERFCRQHPDHPLAAEAEAALRLPWYPPRTVGLASALLPGLGEERLEPGMREAAGPLYSEALFLGATLGFAIAAQSDRRNANLTGALIFANLLLLNHRGSAEAAYATALRRNWAARRTLTADRPDAAIAGPGRFPAEEYAFARTTENPVHDLALFIGYRPWGAGQALAHQGLVREEELANLAWRAEFLLGVADLVREPDFGCSLGVAPYGRVGWNQAHADPNSDLGALFASEFGFGAEAALLTRLGSEEDAWLRLRFSLGPAFRRRTLELGGNGYQDQSAVAGGTFAVGLGGPTGAYWQLGAAGDWGAAAGEFDVAGRRLAVPAWGLEFFSSLGVRF